VADETDRRLFLVEHDLRGLSSWQLATVHRALGEAVRRENQRGRRIRYVQRIYAPDEQRCLCLFEAARMRRSGGGGAGSAGLARARRCGSWPSIIRTTC